MMKQMAMAGMVALTVACESGNEAFHFDEMNYSPRQTVFRLFAPPTAECYVVVEGDSLPMTLGTDSIWTATMKGDQKGKTYAFVVDGQSSPGVFATAVTVNGEKAVVADLRDTDPEGWGTDQRVGSENPADWVVYEMHHRDFSIARKDAEHPGKFLALTEPWALNHLKELGVNAIHILPSYDFGSVDETRLDEPQYNWGYDPVNYNVPEGSYSTDPTDPLCRIREFKQMVQALHKAGIAVILDVVYNHTYDIEHSNFQKTYPDYYYRRIPVTPSEENGDSQAQAASLSSAGSAETVYSNGSGCGNETASEQPMMRRFMIESVKYWAQEYHIDGFRFDLMGVHDIETMNQIRKALDEIDSTIFIYGEGWSAGSCALPNEQLGMKANISRMPGIAAFSDDIRDALRGPFSDDTKCGWLGRSYENGAKESLKAGIAGMIEHPQVDYTKVNYSKKPYATEPTQMMAYVSCHDDMCLVDRLRASIPGISEDELIRLDLLAQTAVFTSQGVPFMLSGEELLRTKQGVHNSFESPDSINQLDWANKDRYPQVFDYYKNLIAMRKHHPSFRIGDATMVRDQLEFLPTADDGIVAYRLKGGVRGDQWSNIVVILNANRQEAKVNVPRAVYTIVAANGIVNELGMDTVPVNDKNEVTVAPQSALIMHD